MKGKSKKIMGNALPTSCLHYSLNNRIFLGPNSVLSRASGRITACFNGFLVDPENNSKRVNQNKPNSKLCCNTTGFPYSSTPDVQDPHLSRVFSEKEN